MKRRLLLGLDVGSSSVKAGLVDADSREAVATGFFPHQEAPVKALRIGWAEQSPHDWWAYCKAALAEALANAGADAADICAIGISWQMHGLVCVDKEQQVLRDAIIWCDSRAVPYGERAFHALGSDYCLSHLLNSPGNFTASKLAWVRDNEPELFERIDKIMLPGDYIAMCLTGETSTTVEGLSEAVLWDFNEQRVAEPVLRYFGISGQVLPHIVPQFGEQGRVCRKAAEETGISEGTPVTYRAGDQPNNAVSLNVFNPGEVAATAGTSGVVYGVLGKVGYDPLSRVNTFAHVNHSNDLTRLGVLLCINGIGSLNAWAHRTVTPQLSYAEMNDLAATAPIGADGVIVMPFGNGAERMLQNKEPGCSFSGISFFKHTQAHILRAVQEGIVFSFCYGMEIMHDMGMNISRIHAGNANMFLSPLFRDTLAGVSGAVIELFETDGSLGAARAAGMGAGIYADHNEAFASLRHLLTVEPDINKREAYRNAYQAWKEMLITNYL